MQHIVRNDTPDTLILSGAENQQITLAPLEQRTFRDLSRFDLVAAQRANILTARQEPPSDTLEKLFSLLMGLGVMVSLISFGVASADPPSWAGDPALWARKVWITAGILVTGIVIARTIYLTKSLRLVIRLLVQVLSLVFTLAIGVGLPAVTVYYFGDGRNLMKSPTPELFGRVLQVAFIAIASLLPGLLFFLFDRYRLSTLRDRLYRDLFRLDRRFRTRSEIDARYGAQIRETFGDEDGGQGRLAPGTRWPVLVCALVITAGWIASFVPVGKVEGNLREMLFPDPSPLTFGFAGAYFFGLRLISRRYARGDLKPKTYGYITIRIVIVTLLCWVMSVTLSEDSKLVLLFAFLIGVLPDEFFTLIREQFRGRLPARLVPEPEKHPLTRLEGIDLYDRARLEQEGIVNVESFAHNEMIHLILETRIPVPRLVDWMDQAILYLHVVNDQDDSRPKLREYGIRTTTDLLEAWKAASERSAEEFLAFKGLLGDDGPPYRLEVIRDTLMDDEWLDRLRDWRLQVTPAEKEVPAQPTSFAAKVAWADSLQKEGRLRDAMQTYLEALEIQDGVEARLPLAELYAGASVVSLRDRTQSRHHADHAFQLGRDDRSVLMRLILVHRDNGDLRDAIVVCDAAIRQVGEPRGNKEKLQVLQTLKETRNNLEQLLEAERGTTTGTP